MRRNGQGTKTPTIACATMLFWRQLCAPIYIILAAISATPTYFAKSTDDPLVFGMRQSSVGLAQPALGVDGSSSVQICRSLVFPPPWDPRSSISKLEFLKEENEEILWVTNPQLSVDVRPPSPLFLPLFIVSVFAVPCFHFSQHSSSIGSYLFSLSQ